MGSLSEVSAAVNSSEESKRLSSLPKFNHKQNPNGESKGAQPAGGHYHYHDEVCRGRSGVEGWRKDGGRTTGKRYAMNACVCAMCTVCMQMDMDGMEVCMCIHW